MLLNISQPTQSKAISLTPLIDVVFILLLFFMLSTSFSRWFSVDVSMPISQHEKPIESAHIRLLNNEGFVSYGGITLKADYARLIRVLQQEQKDSYLIDSANSVSTQTIISLLDYLSLSGLKNVSLGTTFQATQNLSTNKHNLIEGSH